MPANLPPDYYAAERRFRAATDIQEKIEILRDMLAIMPKHKGTDHLQGDLKRKIAKLNSEAQKKKGANRQSAFDHIPVEGAGQAVLVGLPNSGKSSIINYLTHAHTDVADFPFSTYKPVCGMMPFQDIQVQLVDLPPIAENITESWVYNIIRLADVIILTIDLSDDKIIEQILRLKQGLSDHHIQIVIRGERRPQGPVARKTTLLLGTKSDSPGALKNWNRCIENLPGSIAHTKISFNPNDGLDKFRQILFRCLHIVRVYTKTPGKEADMERPYILVKNANVWDAASVIHKELADHMIYARIWGSEKYDGQRVNRDHILEDGDILEIHTK
ncbi:50S ribosome-binding GTPase [bacterium]|nr:50S ribosome-binding GTPase [bacterium]RQV98227.1 MAG: TGS domain-containing protein [bacterium]